MKVVEAIQLIVRGAQIIMPSIPIVGNAIGNVVDMVKQLREMKDERVQRLAFSIEKLGEMNPNAPVTLEEIDAELALLNPKLELDAPHRPDAEAEEDEDEEEI